jgi:hypothetical protein
MPKSVSGLVQSGRTHFASANHYHRCGAAATTAPMSTMYVALRLPDGDLQFELAWACVLLSSERPELSRPQSLQVLRGACEPGFVGVEFEARLLLAEWEKKQDTNRRRDANLAALESSARSKGFGLVARKAATAR